MGQFIAIVASLGKLDEPAINAAYNKLKTSIANRFGKDSDVLQAVERLEQDPDSDEYKRTLLEEIAAAEANQDKQINETALALIEKIIAQPDGEDLVYGAMLSGGPFNAMGGKGGRGRESIDPHGANGGIDD